MRRAVTSAGLWTKPASIACCRFVSGELTRGGDDHDVVDDQRRAREAPEWDLRVCVLGDVARPDDCAVACVECVEDAGCAERVHAAVAQSWRAAWAGAGV